MPCICIRTTRGAAEKNHHHQQYSVTVADLTLSQAVQRLAAWRALLVAIQSILAQMETAATVEEVAQLEMGTLQLQEACLGGVGTSILGRPVGY